MAIKSMLWFLFLILSYTNSLPVSKEQENETSKEILENYFEGNNDHEEKISEAEVREGRNSDGALSADQSKSRVSEIEVREGRNTDGPLSADQSGSRIAEVEVRKGRKRDGSLSTDQSGSFVQTLQAMVASDMQLKSIDEERQKRLEEDPYVWKFYINPRDLEQLLTNLSDFSVSARQGRKTDPSSNKIYGSETNYFIKKLTTSDHVNRHERSSDVTTRASRDDRYIYYTRSKRSAPGQPNPNSPAVLYLPLGGGGVNECLPAAGAKLVHLVPLMFAGMTFTIFDAVANINNNINSNNNNNNNQNINFQQSVNTVVTGNINVANQINVMNMVGRRKRDSEGNKDANHHGGKFISKEDWQKMKKDAAKISMAAIGKLLCKPQEEKP